jgi:hypothetical protein
VPTVQGMTLACIRVDIIAIRWRSPTMPSQALEMGCAIASRHLGEQRTQGRLRCYSVLLREARRTSRYRGH